MSPTKRRLGNDGDMIWMYDAEDLTQRVLVSEGALAECERETTRLQNLVASTEQELSEVRRRAVERDRQSRLAAEESKQAMTARRDEEAKTAAALKAQVGLAKDYDKQRRAAEVKARKAVQESQTLRKSLEDERRVAATKHRISLAEVDRLRKSMVDERLERGLKLAEAHGKNLRLRTLALELQVAAREQAEADRKAWERKTTRLETLLEEERNRYVDLKTKAAVQTVRAQNLERDLKDARQDVLAQRENTVLMQAQYNTVAEENRELKEAGWEAIAGWEKQAAAWELERMRDRPKISTV